MEGLGFGVHGLGFRVGPFKILTLFFFVSSLLGFEEVLFYFRIFPRGFGVRGEGPLERLNPQVPKP